MPGVLVPEWLLISAFRYALGRQSYIVNETIRVLESNAHTLRTNWRLLIVTEIRDAVRTGAAGSSYDADNWTRLADTLEGTA